MATTAEMLAQAREAYHLLLTGAKTVSIRYADRSVQYTEANKADLREYIAELEQLAGETPQQMRGEPFEVIW